MSARGASDVRARWNAARAEYWAKRADFENGDKSDAALDALFDAGLVVMFETATPDAEAMRFKLSLVDEYFNDGSDDWLGRFVSDLLRDAKVLAGEAV